MFHSQLAAEFHHPETSRLCRVTACGELAIERQKITDINHCDRVEAELLLTTCAGVSGLPVSCEAHNSPESFGFPRVLWIIVPKRRKGTGWTKAHDLPMTFGGLNDFELMEEYNFMDNYGISNYHSLSADRSPNEHSYPIQTASCYARSE